MVQAYYRSKYRENSNARQQCGECLACKGRLCPRKQGHPLNSFQVYKLFLASGPCGPLPPAPSLHRRTGAQVSGKDGAIPVCALAFTIYLLAFTPHHCASRRYQHVPERHGCCQSLHTPPATCSQHMHPACTRYHIASASPFAAASAQLSTSTVPTTRPLHATTTTTTRPAQLCTRLPCVYLPPHAYPTPHPCYPKPLLGTAPPAPSCKHPTPIPLP